MPPFLTGLAGRLAPVVAPGFLLLLAACNRTNPAASPAAPPAAVPTKPAELTSWPWSGSRQDVVHRGVRCWTARTTDGTGLHLLRFDFRENRRLELRLFDQDQSLYGSRNDSFTFFGRGIGTVLNTLESGLKRKGERRVVAAWNGSFFTLDHRHGQADPVARHIAPIVLNHHSFYNVGNHRWTFGVDSDGAFKCIHMPDKATLDREFEYGAGGVQCLVRAGKPLKLSSPPAPGSKVEQSQPSSEDEAGPIPIVDHMRTSRTSLGWSRDNRFLYLLVVHEPDTETASALALRHGEPQIGGWTVPDLQRFWLSMNVWGAVNLDGGGLTQAAWLRTDGRYSVVPSRTASAEPELVVGNPSSIPAGEPSIMYFCVMETKR